MIETDCPTMTDDAPTEPPVELLHTERLGDIDDLDRAGRRNEELQRRLRKPQTVGEIIWAILREAVRRKSEMPDDKLPTQVHR